MTPTIFPRETRDWHALELPAWRTVALSSLATGATTGVVLRLLPAAALAAGAGAGVALLVGYLLPALLLCGVLAVHLAHFPVRRWPRHATAFVAAEVVAELLVAASLVALGREPLGSAGLAHWHDLPAIAASTAAWRVVAAGLFTALLAAVVQLVRMALARRGRHHLHVEGGHVVVDAPPVDER